MRAASLAILALSIVTQAGGQHRLDPVARASGGVWLRGGGDPWAVLGAAPLLATAPGARFGIASFPAPWGLPELSGHAAVFALPAGPGAIGLALTRTGFDLLSETTLSLAFGGRAGIVCYGLTARYRALRIERHGSAWIPGVDAAVVIGAAGWLSWGIRVIDAISAPVGRTGERTREGVSLALNVGPPGGPILAMQLGREVDGQFSTSAGLSYGRGEALALLLGTSGALDRIHCGLEITPGPVNVGYGALVHPVLGVSHSVWVGFGAAP